MNAETKCDLHTAVEAAGPRIAEYVAHLETEAAFNQLKREQAERENAELRAALVTAGNELSAVAGLLGAYPRMSNDPNGRMLLDAREMAKESARAALAKVQS